MLTRLIVWIKEGNNRIDIVYPDFEDKEPISISQPGLLESSPYIIVNTEDQLEQLIQSLSQEDIIGFDIREHSYRSYLGFICIITVRVSMKDNHE